MQKFLSLYAAEPSPAKEYLKTTLDTEDVIIFTDRPQRSAYILAKDILTGFEKPFKHIALNKVDHGQEILKELDKITDNKELPHLFYRGKYVGGSREIVLQYESGELEAALGVEPYMELPKMYPDAEDFAERERLIAEEAAGITPPY